MATPPPNQLQATVVTSGTLSSEGSFMSTTGSNDLLEFIQIVMYYQAGTSPRDFAILLDDGWLFFGDNVDFCQQTDHPFIQLELYDPDLRQFVPVIVDSALKITGRFRPWLIIRISGMTDGQCVDLYGSIEEWEEAHEYAMGILRQQHDLHDFIVPDSDPVLMNDNADYRPGSTTEEESAESSGDESNSGEGTGDVEMGEASDEDQLIEELPAPSVMAITRPVRTTRVNDISTGVSTAGQSHTHLNITLPSQNPGSLIQLTNTAQEPSSSAAGPSRRRVGLLTVATTGSCSARFITPPPPYSRHPPLSPIIIYENGREILDLTHM